MNNVIIIIGISGSGKSTYATQFIRDNVNYVRCNRDDIRRVLVGDLVSYYTRKDVYILENIVSSMQDRYIDKIKYKNYNMIIDNTNLHKKYIQSIIDFIGSDYTIQFKLFDCNLKQAKSRVYQRDYLSTNDPNKVDYIDKQYRQYQSIKKWILETYPNNIIK